MDIANIGFRADTSALVDAKQTMDALVPSAQKAERASEKFSKMLDRVGGVADKLVSASTGLASAVDRLSAVIGRQSAAMNVAAGSASSLNSVTVNLSSGMNNLTTNTTRAVSSANQLGVTANSATAKVEKLSVATKQAGNSAATASTQFDLLRSKAAAIQGVQGSGAFSNARDRGADVEAYGASLDNLRAKYNPLFAVIQRYKENIREIREANRLGAISVEEMNVALGRQRTAALTAIGGIKGHTGAVAGAAVAGKLTANEMLNLSRQFADVGVTAAMGMSPLMIMIQQGPQIADVFQQASARGMTFAMVLRAIAASAWAALAPLLPVILAIGAAAGVMAAGFALAARSFRKDNENIAASMGLTEKQMGRLKKAGVETSITIGDAWGGFWDTVGDRLTKAFAGPLKWLADTWNNVLDAVTTAGLFVIKSLIAGWVAGYYIVKATWSMLPSAMGDFAVSAVNLTITAIAKLVNKSIEGINGLIGMLPDWVTDKTGNITFRMDEGARIANPNAGAGARLGAATADAGRRAWADTGAAMDRFGADWGKNARKRREKAIREAEGPGDTAKKSHGKTDAEKFQDIVDGANRRIAAMNAEIAGINLTSEAAAKLKYQTELLNEAQQANLHLTPQQTEQLMALGAQMGETETRLKNLKGFKEITDGAEKSLRALQSEGLQIGLVGEAAQRMRYEQDLLNQAKDKDITLTQAQTDALKANAAQLAATAQANANLTAYTNARNSQREAAGNSAVEMASIGASPEQAARLAETQRIYNDEVYRGVTLSAEQKKDLVDGAGLQARLTEQVDKTRDAFEFAKDSVKGFVTDMANGLRQGKGLFETFTSALLNMLNKLIDKLAETAINMAFEGAGGGGGFFGKLLGIGLSVLGGGPQSSFAGANGLGSGSLVTSGMTNVGSLPTYATGFAKGSAFANGIYNTPTLFKFAKGGSIGQMGEAGPEGVLPLARGPDGSLGVQMYGDGGGTPSGPVHNDIKVNNTFKIEGAVSSDDIIALTRQSAERTKSDVKNSLMGWLQQFNRDGGFTK